jgi:hypothetical protein
MATPQKKTKIGHIQQRILELLKQNGPQSRLELLCAVYQYRHAAGNILYWSVLERQYLQQKKFDDATKLLERVLEYAEKRGFPESPTLKPEPTFDDLEPQFPPEKIVVQHATRRVTNEAEMRAAYGTSTGLAEFGTRGFGKSASRGIGQSIGLSGMGGLYRTLAPGASKSILENFEENHGLEHSQYVRPQSVDAIKRRIVGLGLSSQRPEPQYEEIPEKHGTHPWYLYSNWLKPYLEKWSWREWQKHPEERACRTGELEIQLQKLVNKAHASITRALKTLEQSGSIEMTPGGWIIRGEDVKTLPEDLLEKAKNA